jgi:HEAT repeat protein
VTTAHIQPVSSQQSDVTRNIQQLTDANDGVRSESALQLGRLRAPEAIDPLAATLAGDRSPQVREAAARALALIGSPKALPALQHAALADADATVRHSAEFSIDVIRTR